MTLVVGAGPLYAMMDRADDDHEPSQQLLSTHPGPLGLPTMPIAEAMYLASARLGTRAEIALLEDLEAGYFQVEPVYPTDWTRIKELVEKYQDLPLGTADASVLACAERLEASQIATLDRRHFSVVRPKHVEALTLLP